MVGENPVSCILRLGLSVVLGIVVMLQACGEAAHTLRAHCNVRPRPGLYEVVARQCENPLQETDYCPLTQYIEIAASDVYGVPDGPHALAFWYAEQRESPEYSYQANVLRGRCLDAEHFLIEKDAEAEASFTLHAGVPTAYAFVGYTDNTRRKLLFRMRLSLRPVQRTPVLDQRLRIERP